MKPKSFYVCVGAACMVVAVTGSPARSQGYPFSQRIGFAGLPDDISQSPDCGGTDSYAIVDIRQVEVREDVFHWLVRGHDVNLDVYQLSTFVDLCTSTPVAHGRGTLKYHDNDLIETGRENTFGWWAAGPVTLASGGSANLLEQNLWQLLPTGTFRRIFRQVKLSGQ